MLNLIEGTALLFANGSILMAILSIVGYPEYIRDLSLILINFLLICFFIWWFFFYYFPQEFKDKIAKGFGNYQAKKQSHLSKNDRDNLLRWSE